MQLSTTLFGATEHGDVASLYFIALDYYHTQVNPLTYVW